MKTEEELKEYKHQHYLKNKQRYVDKAREWKKQNKSRVRFLENRRRDEDRDRFRDLQKGWNRSTNTCPRWRKDHPEKYEAHLIFLYALRHGEVLKPDCCSRCGLKSNRLHGHHDDYSKPLAVLWLCPLCHGKAHRMEVVDVSISA